MKSCHSNTAHYFIVGQEKSHQAMNKSLGQISYLTLIILLLTNLGVHVSPMGKTFEESSGLTNLFRLRGEVAPPDQSIIVSMNSDSAQALSLPRDIEYWPQKQHAQLISNLTQLGVKGIIYDIPTRKNDNESDNLPLAQTLHEANNVIMSSAQSAASEDFALDNSITRLHNSTLAHGKFVLPNTAIIHQIDLYPEEFQYQKQQGNLPLITLHLFAKDSFPLLLKGLEAIGANDIAQQFSSLPDLMGQINLLIRFFQSHPPATQKIEDWLNTQIDPNKDVILSLMDGYKAEQPVYVNFYGGAKHLPSIPYEDVLLVDPKQNNANIAQLRLNLAGKIVFLGATEPASLGSNDLHYTIYSTTQGADMSTLELHNTVFNNLLERKTLTPLSIWVQISIILCLVLLLFTPSRWLNLIPWMVFAFSTTSAYATLVFILFRDCQILMPLAVPVFVLLPTTVAAVLWRHYRRNLKAHRSTKKTLEQYIPTHIAGEMSRNVSRLNQQRQLVQSVCLLTDIRGFTAFAEFCPPDRLHSIMNDYYRIVSRIVRKNNGTVINIVGDGLLAIWSGPTMSKDMVYKASYAALLIISETDKYNSQLFDGPNTIMRRAGTNIATCIGIHGGELSIGNLGSTSHFEYAPVGDTVNTTSRIEAYTRQLNARILVSDVIQDKLDDFITKDHGPIALKGKSKSVGVHELVGMRKSDKKQH